MRTAELVADAAWVTLGLGICLYALRLRLWDASVPASGFLPFLAGVFIAVVGLALFLRGCARRRVSGSPSPFWWDRLGRYGVSVVIGVLLGNGPLAALSLLLPVSFNVPAVSSIVMLSAIFYGAMYGGSTTSVLVNIPGEAASVVTCLDGYQMAKAGRAGAALGMAAFG